MTDLLLTPLLLHGKWDQVDNKKVTPNNKLCMTLQTKKKKIHL